MNSDIFDYLNISIDAAAELIAQSMIESKTIKIKEYKPSLEFVKTPEIITLIEKYKIALIDTVERSELQTTKLRKTLDNTIITNETRVAFSQLIEWMKIRNVPIRDEWGFYQYAFELCYERTEDEYLFRRAIESQNELAQKLSKLNIFSKGFSLEDLERVTKEQLYELCKYLLIATYKLESEKTKFHLPKNDDSEREVSLRGIGYMAILLARGAYKYKRGVSVNSLSIKSAILDLVKDIAAKNQHGDEPPTTYGLRSFDKKISAGIDLIIEDCGTTEEDILQMQD